MFEKRCTLKLKTDSGDWKTLGMGDIKIMYDKESFTARVTMIQDESENKLCDTPITLDTTIEVR